MTKAEIEEKKRKKLQKNKHGTAGKSEHDILSATKRPATQSSSASVYSDTACQSILKTKPTQLSQEITIKTQELSSTCSL